MVARVMTEEDPQWEEFVERLIGSEGCDVRLSESGRNIWRCGGDEDKKFAIGILQKMGLTAEAVRESCLYFESRGGYCDCEILMNVAEEI